MQEIEQDNSTTNPSMYIIVKRPTTFLQLLHMLHTTQKNFINVSGCMSVYKFMHLNAHTFSSLCNI